MCSRQNHTTFIWNAPNLLHKTRVNFVHVLVLGLDFEFLVFGFASLVLT